MEAGRTVEQDSLAVNPKPANQPPPPPQKHQPPKQPQTTGRGPEAAAHPGVGAEREGGRDQVDGPGPSAGAGPRQRAHQAGT